MARLTIVHQGGSVIYDKAELKPHQIERMRELLAGEIVCSAATGATAHFKAATELLMQLTVADSECARWRAASSPIYRRTI